MAETADSSLKQLREAIRGSEVRRNFPPPTRAVEISIDPWADASVSSMAGHGLRDPRDRGPHPTVGTPPSSPPTVQPAHLPPPCRPHLRLQSRRGCGALSEASVGCGRLMAPKKEEEKKKKGNLVPRLPPARSMRPRQAAALLYALGGPALLGGVMVQGAFRFGQAALHALLCAPSVSWSPSFGQCSRRVRAFP